MTEQIHDIGKRRAWVIWLVALSVYVLAVFNRSSLGVAGLLATQRFGISATQLSFFTVLQLVVYAGLQVPIGVLLDRFGSRILLLSGLALMAVGQLVFAVASSFPVAVLARAVLGAGDAAIFVSVIRLVTLWFLVRQAPLVTQLTGQAGQLGAVAAAAPLSLALQHLGWTRSFSIASSLGIVGMVAVALVVKDSPYARQEVARTKMRALARSLRLVWGNPGTRLGMWSHFTSQFSGTVFALLWGYPFLVRGEGLGSGTASALLMLMTGWVIVSGLVLGALVSRFPFWRSRMVLTVVAAMAVAWAVVLLRTTPAPLWLLVVLVCAMASGGPASMVGFDLARTFIPVEASGRANGFVNVGGFSASLLTIGLVGVLLDWHSGGGADRYDLSDFRVAMSVQFVFWAFGSVQVLRFRRKAISHLDRLHPGVVDAMKRGEAVVHLGFHEREGV
ncbi:MAG TPA: MFS transporter [Nocardioides sp.]|uniref:MFS transporter n=1 Tax=Nocardioides sp. TaxID=35761 RepID=UPI002E369588|nr:MFS transporter [Nocardioides sp.]HEX3932954.1 MFS transporter [Nocardioides sp.]